MNVTQQIWFVMVKHIGYDMLYIDTFVDLGLSLDIALDSIFLLYLFFKFLLYQYLILLVHGIILRSY